MNTINVWYCKKCEKINLVKGNEEWPMCCLDLMYMRTQVLQYDFLKK